MIGDDTKLVCGNGVGFKILTGAAMTFIRNVNWSAPLAPVTSITPTAVPGTLQYKDIVVATTYYDGTTAAKTISVGNYMQIKGDPLDFYNGVFRVVAVTNGVSFTVRIARPLSFAAPNITDYPTVTSGSTVMGIAGFQPAIPMTVEPLVTVG